MATEEYSIGYQDGRHAGIDEGLAIQRTWVGLTWDDLPDLYVGDIAFMDGAKWAEAKLKEKNNGA